VADGWLSSLLGYHRLKDGLDALFPQRSTLKIVGGTLTDDEEEKQTVLDLSALAAPGFTPARYSGHATAGISWTSTTWSGVANAATLIDAEQTGITRSGSAWTFAAAGEYVIHFASKTLRTVSADIGIRARKSGVTVGGPSLSAMESSSRMSLARLHKCLSLAAGDVVTLEYAVTSAFASAAAVTLDGEAGHVCDIEIYRVG
jgi:hypothetical protein